MTFAITVYFDEAAPVLWPPGKPKLFQDAVSACVWLTEHMDEMPITATDFDVTACPLRLVTR